MQWMIKRLNMLLLTMLFAFSAFATDPFMAGTFLPLLVNKNSFDSLEHQFLGDQVHLRWPEQQKRTHRYPLQLPNGLYLTYGQILMLAGDLIGDPSCTISFAEKKVSCFENQFASLAIADEKNSIACKNPLMIVPTILTYLKTLENDLNEARNQGKTDAWFYKKHGLAINQTLNRLTCGGSLTNDFIPFGTYLKLAQINFDHFMPDALMAYKTGHQEALLTAQKAYVAIQKKTQAEGLALLELAYAKNAFASHYLTDAMAAGHMRTPRRFISKTIPLPNIVTLLIANLMHDEDNEAGLMVKNTDMTWQAFGDDNLNRPEAATHRAMMQKVLQSSVDAIYTTFLTGEIPPSYTELQWVPIYDASLDGLNTAPLFKVENDQILKRIHNEDRYDYHWTPHWDPIQTLLDFYFPPKIVNDLKQS